jgi:hypothetical protein
MSQEISTLKVEFEELKSKKGPSSSANNDNVQNNAGCQFGGCQGKEQANEDS